MGVVQAGLLLALLAVSLPASQCLRSFLVLPLDRPNQEVFIKGSRLVSANLRGILAFEGIRYAQAPTGELRFLPPRPLLEYPEVLIASKKPPPCPFINGRGQLIGSEDCLFLNVYVPEDAVKARETLPVLVMLPGLGWAGRWNPHRIVDRRVVLVTVQSRSSALGFLTTGTPDAPGNAGLRDEALALEWVRKNIKGFFGDPTRITLGGVGVGAAAVQLHMVSPVSAGAFNRTISISGSALSPWAVAANTREAVELTKQLASNLGCALSHPNISASSLNTTATVQCLRNKSVFDIVLGTKHLQGWLGLPPSPFVPVVDGTFLPDSPRALWEAGRAARVPLLVGLAKGEGLSTVLPNINESGLFDNNTILEDLYHNWTSLAPVLLAFNATPSEQREQAAALLREHYFPAPGDNTSSKREALLRLVSDRHVVLPALRTLSLHAAGTEGTKGTKGAPAFLYLYSWTGSLVPQKTSPLLGPESGRDAEMLFMEPSPRENTTNPLLRAMTGDILDLWASFIATGKPQVGNTTLNSSLENTSGGDLKGLNLKGPGQRENMVMEVNETIAFWDALPLQENNKTLSSKRESKTDAHDSHVGSRASHTYGFEALCLGIAGALHVVTMRHLSS